MLPGPTTASPARFVIGSWWIMQLEKNGPITPTTPGAAAYARALRRHFAGEMESVAVDPSHET